MPRHSSWSQRQAEGGRANGHVDSSFPPDLGDTNDFLNWRVNVFSKGRALLMLFLFSDVGESDAPTLIRVGSHLDVARILSPAGDNSLSARDLAAAEGFAETAARREVLATGDAGTVYLCHPFLVHAAQQHRGSRPRFLAQPPLVPAGPFFSTARIWGTRPSSKPSGSLCRTDELGLTP